MQLLPNGKTQWIDQNGLPLANGTVGFYAPGTLNPLPTYQDSAGTIQNTNPVVLDSRGQAIVWGNTTYRQIVKDVSGVTIWDQLVQSPDAGFLSFQANLADTSNVANGDALVGVKQPLTGAAARTQHDKNLDQISAKDFGAKGDGVTDDTAALKAFGLVSARAKYLPAGTYIVNDMITFQAGDTVYGDGDASVITPGASFNAAATAVVFVTGTLTALAQALSVSPNIGDAQLTFASAPAVNPNDCLCIYNPTNSSFSPWRTNYRQGEFVRAGLLSGAVLSILDNLWDSYTAAAVTVYKLVGARTTFKDLNIQGPSANLVAPLQMSLIDHPVVENVKTGGSTYCGIYLDRCVDIDVHGRAFQVSAASGYQYGLLISNCQGGIVQGEFYGNRHGIAPGGSDIVGGVPCRAIRFIADTHNNAVLGSIDPHGNSEGLIFQGCRFTNGFVLSGANHKFSNCTFYGNLNFGTALYGGELVKGSFDFDNCTFASNNNPNTVGNGNRGILDFSLQANTQNACGFNFNNCNFSAPAGCVYVNRFSVDGANVTFTVSYTNPRLTAAPAVTQFASLQRTSGTGSLASFTLSDITGLPSGGTAFYAVTDGIIPVSLWRLPTQTSIGSIPVTSGSNQNSAVLNFQYKYPVAPVVTLTALNSAAGGAKAMVNVSATTVSSVTANCSSTSGTINFSSNDTMGVNVTATLQQ